MAYSANDLNKRIEIWKYDLSVNEAGTPKEVLLLYKTTYANLKLLNGSVKDSEPAGEIPLSNVKFVIRYDKNINYRCEVRYNNLKYKINYIEGDLRSGFLTLSCITFNEFK